MNNPIVRAERVTFNLIPHDVDPDRALEFFRMPDGEKRVSVTSAATVCGFAKNYLTGLARTSPNRLKTLRGLGFEGERIPALVERGSQGSKGSSRSETLSLDDFRKFLEFAAFEVGSIEALAIVRGLIGVSLESIAKQAFGEEALTLEEIRRHLCREYAKTINWTKEDQMDFEDIENHQIFLEAS
jgi:hypothetical protein